MRFTGGFLLTLARLERRAFYSDVSRCWRNVSTRLFPAADCTDSASYPRYYSAPAGVRSIVINPSACLCLCVCLSASISLERLDRSARNFVRGSPVAVARSSSDGVTLSYAVPVLWMTSRLAVMGGTPAMVGSTQCRRSITCATGAESDVMNACFNL